jgi:hypothetical protein
MCRFPGCHRRAFTKGLCGGHDQQRRQGRELSLLRRHAYTVLRQQPDEHALEEFRNERRRYELKIECAAYECAVGVAARVLHRREIQRLERELGDLSGQVGTASRNGRVRACL